MIKRSKSWLAERNAGLADKWLSSARFFARGEAKRVYRKKESSYPIRAIIENGNVVKVFHLLNQNGREKAKQIFWEMRIIHELFPQNTLKPRGVFYRKPLNQRAFVEVHVDEVPVHHELAKYQELLAREQTAGHISGVQEVRDAYEVYYSKGAKMMELMKEMESAGIVNDNSFSNISLHDPNKPVFFEPSLFSGYNKLNLQTIQQKEEQVLAYMRQHKHPPQKIRQIQNYFENLRKTIKK